MNGIFKNKGSQKIHSETDYCGHSIITAYLLLGMYMCLLHAKSYEFYLLSGPGQTFSTDDKTICLSTENPIDEWMINSKPSQNWLRHAWYIYGECIRSDMSTWVYIGDTSDMYTNGKRTIILFMKLRGLTSCASIHILIYSHYWW